MCQKSLYPSGWVVAWRDGGRSGFAAYPSEAAARLALTATLMVVSRSGVVTSYRDGEPVVEFRWRARRRMRLTKAAGTGSLFDEEGV